MSDQYSKLILTSLEFPYLRRGFDPQECYVCRKAVAPLVEYELTSTNACVRGKCCTQCVVKMIVEVAQESGRNAELAKRNSSIYERRDALLEDENDAIIRDEVRFVERFQQRLVFNALTPEFLLFRQKKSCPRCHNKSSLFRFAWKMKGKTKSGACCDECAFDMTGHVFGATLQAKTRAKSGS